MSDELAGLLRSYRPPPPSAGLAERVAAAAMAHVQDPALPPARVGRGRRSRWLVRPLIVGAGALGIAVSSAVAASFAGIELPQPVQKLVEQLPLVGKQRAPEPEPAAPVRQVAAPAPRAVPVPAPPPTPQMEAPSATPRYDAMQRWVERRRASGLPTPGADAMDRRMAQRRAAGLPVPTPEQIERRLERQQAWRDGRRLRGAQLRREWQALPPEERAAQMREWRARRQAFQQGDGLRPGGGASPGDEVRRERFERWRERRMQRMRMMPPPRDDLPPPEQQ